MEDKICFILYKPAVPGNIGASARALKTMGFTELRLIDPADHLADEAKMMAHGSHDILENGKIYKTFREATVDIDFIISTTAKLKSAKVDYLNAEKLPSFLKEKLPLVNKAGIVFGTEESGLPKSILLEANIGLTIPMKTEYPSLNLSQAVMIVAYEVSKLRHSASTTIADQQDDAAWKQLQERSNIILEEAGIKPGTPLYHRIIERISFLKASDARLLHSVSARLLEMINKKVH